jgi:glycosyltransferase involved in cell wall biosynthesis
LTLTPARPVCITVLAHQEEARIATCIGSLPLSDPHVAIHIVVNGSTDQTAAIARKMAAQHNNVTVHEFAEGGKSRSWNRFVFETIGEFHPVHIFVDGDAEVSPDSVKALQSILAENSNANAGSALPLNGRKVGHYQDAMRRELGLFGDLYALRGDFLARMKAAGIRLPDDLVGDDGLLAAMAKTDLKSEANWDDARVAICEGAGFLCEPVGLGDPRSWRLQYRRMINYSVRYFQNRMITKIMRRDGPAALPKQMLDLYAQELPGLAPRASFPEIWFDRIALRRMAARNSG